MQCSPVTFILFCTLDFVTPLQVLATPLEVLKGISHSPVRWFLSPEMTVLLLCMILHLRLSKSAMQLLSQSWPMDSKFVCNSLNPWADFACCGSSPSIGISPSFVDVMCDPSGCLTCMGACIR